MTESLQIGGGQDRRSFVRGGLAAAAVATGAALLPNRAVAANADTLPNLYPNWNAFLFQSIQSHEIEHVTVIRTLITTAGCRITGAAPK